MRLKIKLDMKGVHLPYSYATGVQAFLYSAMKPKTAYELHDAEPNKIKEFNFSNIIGKVKADGSGLTFLNTGILFVSAIDLNILNEIYMHIVKYEQIEVCGNFIDLIDIDVEENPMINGTVEYQTISPITMYRTLDDGYHEYIAPFDDEFEESLRNNIARKYEQAYGSVMDEYFHVYMIRKVKKNICTYKGFKYAAYSCCMKIDTTANVHSLIMDLGLGSRNSAGFGMMEVLKRK